MTFLKINVLSYLEASAARVPDRVCWADAASALTYREAWTAVCNMGAALSERLSVVNAPVCVLLRHDVTDLLAFFSIVYSGNFYVPIDPALPAVRLRSMLETLKPAAIMTAGASIDAELTQDIPVISQQELHTEAPAAAPWKQRKDTDLLYVIFTSGSTGEPKGVSICHRSVIDMVEQFMRAFDFADGAVWGNQAPFDFDVSVKDIFLSLRVGGRLEILEKKLFSFPKLLLERLNGRSVDTIIWAVPALKILARLHAFQTLRPLYLRNIMFSGEVMPPKTLQYWMQAVPQARFVNLYGPTEITCNCTYHIVQSADEVLQEVPIGRPFANCDVFLLDGEEPVREEGKTGEICVTGSCLSLGYYNRPQLSAQAFVQNPLNPRFREPMYPALCGKEGHADQIHGTSYRDVRDRAVRQRRRGRGGIRLRFQRRAPDAVLYGRGRGKGPACQTAGQAPEIYASERMPPVGALSPESHGEDRPAGAADFVERGLIP